MNCVELHPNVNVLQKTDFSKTRSPGMKHKHYSPDAKIIVVEGDYRTIARVVQDLSNKYVASGKKVGILTTDENKVIYKAHQVKSLGRRDNLKGIAKNLFKFMREFDEEKVDIIIAEGVPTKGLGLAVMNRLRRASEFNIYKARDG